MHKCWTEYIRERIEAREPRTPWRLMNKLKWYAWCEEQELPTVEVLRVFDTPELIDLHDVHGSFVLKPTSESAMKGVMVLTRNPDDTYHESLKDRQLTHEEIVGEQTELLSNSQTRTIIVERKVEDIDEGFTIPRDYKAYAFNGHIELIAQIDRSTKPATATWFDGEFNLIVDGRIKNDTWYIKNGSAEAPESALQMLEIAKKASVALDTPFARIDMYDSSDGPILGELTLTPGGMYYGTSFVLSDSQNYRMGLLWERAKEELREQNLGAKAALQPSDRILNSLEERLTLNHLQTVLELDGMVTIGDYQRAVKSAREEATQLNVT